MPLTGGGRFILAKAEVYGRGHLFEQPREFEIRRRIVDRIPANDEQGIHYASLNILHELLKISRIRIRRLNVINRDAGIAEGIIQLPRDALRIGGSELIRENNASSRMGA